jgi:hypothetical protein
MRRMDKATVTRIRMLFLLMLAGLFIMGVAAANIYVPNTADVHVYRPYPRNCYFRVEVKVDDTTFDYPAWCADLDHTITLCIWYSGASLTEKFEQGMWGKINWILNNKGSYDWTVIQAAIWRALGYSWEYIDLKGGLGLSDTQKATAEALLSSADPNFVPGPGDIVAVYVDPGSNIQKFIFEYPIPGGVPEFSEGVPAVASLTLASYILLKRRLKVN